MNFLRTLFWIVLTVVVVVFTLHNWTPVTIDLFGGLLADVQLPVLLAIVFLAGFLPAYAYHRWWRWREGRARLGSGPIAEASPAGPLGAVPAAEPAHPAPPLEGV